MSLISWEYYDESQDFSNLRYVLLDIHNYVIICTKWEKSKYVQYSDLFWCKMHVRKHCKIFQPGCNDHLDFSRECALLQLIIPFLYLRIQNAYCYFIANNLIGSVASQVLIDQ